MNDQDYKKTVGAAFDEASVGYDSPALRFFDNTAKELVKSAGLKGREQVLDAATGTGKVALEAARRLKLGYVSGIDLSEGMLAQARRKAAAEGLANVSFEKTDVDRAVFDAGKFDGLFCSFGVHFWADMEQSLSRLLKPLKPGAFVAITSFAKGSFEPQSGLTLKRFTQYGIKLPATYTWEKLDNEAKALALFDRLGLTEIRQYRAQMGYSLKNTSEWWDLVRFTGFRAFLDKMTPEQIVSFREENEREVSATAGKDGIPLRVEVIFTQARVGR